MTDARPFAHLDRLDCVRRTAAGRLAPECVDRPSGRCDRRIAHRHGQVRGGGEASTVARPQNVRGRSPTVVAADHDRSGRRRGGGQIRAWRRKLAHDPAVAASADDLHGSRAGACPPPRPRPVDRRLRPLHRELGWAGSLPGRDRRSADRGGTPRSPIGRRHPSPPSTSSSPRYVTAASPEMGAGSGVGSFLATSLDRGWPPPPASTLDVAPAIGAEGAPHRRGDEKQRSASADRRQPAPSDDNPARPTQPTSPLQSRASLATPASSAPSARVRMLLGDPGHAHKGFLTLGTAAPKVGPQPSGHGSDSLPGLRLLLFRLAMPASLVSTGFGACSSFRAWRCSACSRASSRRPGPGSRPARRLGQEGRRIQTAGRHAPIPLHSSRRPPGTKPFRRRASRPPRRRPFRRRSHQRRRSSPAGHEPGRLGLLPGAGNHGRIVRYRGRWSGSGPKGAGGGAGGDRSRL